MNQESPWKINIEAHSLMPREPLASIATGRWIGILTLVLICILCLIRINPELIPKTPTAIVPKAEAPHPGPARTKPTKPERKPATTRPQS